MVNKKTLGLQAAKGVRRPLRSRLRTFMAFFTLQSSHF